jgi:glycosyltransferase involved in cell wall biosynthesis
MISVCIATYNGEKYIEEQIKSILNQIGEEDELIISDDGSKDETCKIIKNLNDNRIKLYYNSGVHGFTHNFENALSYAKGDYIFLADQDDIWKENKVEVTIEVLKKYDFAISDCITIDENMKVIQQSRFKTFNMKKGFIRHLMKSRFLGCCMAFRKEVLIASMPFPEDDFLVEHDIWLAAVAFLYFKVKLIEEPLIYYRRHGKNASGGGFVKGYSLKVKIQKRMYRLKHLFLIRKKVYEVKK